MLQKQCKKIYYSNLLTDAAKEEITTAYETAMAEKIGEIPVGTTVKQYIDSAIGTGDSDVATAIATAKAEAIAASKEYTDTALNVVEF